MVTNELKSKPLLSFSKAKLSTKCDTFKNTLFLRDTYMGYFLSLWEFSVSNAEVKQVVTAAF